MTRTLVGIVLISLVGYGALKAWPIIRGPYLTIVTPNSYTSLTDGIVSVSGVAHNTEALFLNNGVLFIDQKGRFSTELSLPSGGAILTLTAHDRFGRSTTVRRTVYIP